MFKDVYSTKVSFKNINIQKESKTYVLYKKLTHDETMDNHDSVHSKIQHFVHFFHRPPCDKAWHPTDSFSYTDFHGPTTPYFTKIQ